MQLKELFEIKNGVPSSQVCLLDSVSENCIPYIRPSKTQRGTISGYVDKNEVSYKDIYPSNTIFVSTNGQSSHTYSYVSDFEFVPNSDVAVLIPKQELTIQIKLFYALCISNNRYKFSYGRKPKGDKLACLDLPSPKEVPPWVHSFPIPTQLDFQKSFFNHSTPDLFIREWKEFRYDELFEIKKGQRLTSQEMNPGRTPYIGASAKNNGITDYIDRVAIHSGNTITVSYDGSIGEAFYQEAPYWCSDAVNAFYPKFEMNVYRAMFIIGLIRKERYRYNYGRKWTLEKMKDSVMKLPVNQLGSPDWACIEFYVKTLKFSNNLSLT